MHAAATIALAFAVACVSIAARAESQTVHRCIGEHGEISFSGLPCAGAAAPSPAQSGSTSPRTTGGAIAGTHDSCPASADALRDVIAEAFARRDANTLAGVMRWDGIGHSEVPSRMRELAELTQRPLVGIDVGDAALEANAIDTPVPAPEHISMIVHTGGLDGGATEHEFRVTTSGGCFWLDW